MRIQDINIVTENQHHFHALAFIPKGASETNKLPVVITSPGWLNSGGVQDVDSIIS